MTNVLLGLLLWGFALADIFIRQRGREVAAKYGMRWLNIPPVMT